MSHSWNHKKSGWNFHFDSDFGGTVHVNPSCEGWEEQCIEIPFEALREFMNMAEERMEEVRLEQVNPIRNEHSWYDDR